MPIAPVKFQCTVADDSEAIFRPAIYRIKDYCPIGREIKTSTRPNPRLHPKQHRLLPKRSPQRRQNQSLQACWNEVESVKTGEASPTKSSLAPQLPRRNRFGHCKTPRPRRHSHQRRLNLPRLRLQPPARRLHLRRRIRLRRTSSSPKTPAR